MVSVVSHLAELARVAARLPAVEWGRRAEGPEPLVRRLRDRGRGARRRTPEDRARLQRVIAAVDRWLPGESSCYRRVLLELSLDAGAAEEPMHLGLRVPGGPRSGHAWLGAGGAGADAAVPASRTYDVQLDM
jgi:hypothetical protein